MLPCVKGFFFILSPAYLSLAPLSFILSSNAC
jgi:hypothetical protein